MTAEKRLDDLYDIEADREGVSSQFVEVSAVARYAVKLLREFHMNPQCDGTRGDAGDCPLHSLKLKASAFLETGIVPSDAAPEAGR